MAGVLGYFYDSNEQRSTKFVVGRGPVLAITSDKTLPEKYKLTKVWAVGKFKDPQVYFHLTAITTQEVMRPYTRCIYHKIRVSFVHDCH